MAEAKNPQSTKAQDETTAEIAEARAEGADIAQDTVAANVDVTEDDAIIKDETSETKPKAAKKPAKPNADSTAKTEAAEDNAKDDAETANNNSDDEDDDASETDQSDEAKAERKLAKAGKHSAKAVREAEAEAKRQEAKEHRAEHEAETPKPRVRQLPNPLKAHGKKYRESAKLIELGKAYSLDEALELTRKTATTKFDASIELHVNLGVDPRQADQMVRASVVLPHGTGKKLRVAVYADGKAAEDAKTAGADLIGTTDLIASIEKGKLDFDLLIATPQGMATLGKVAKVLGPRGLMPNPKSGTVTPNVADAVKEAKAGKIEFRIDKQAIVHQAIGKASFSAEHLQANATAFLSAILKAKPASAKGTYVKALHASASMGPGVKIDAPGTISAISTSKK